ncbi:MAG: GNAT family N-acetyltransferase [Desulfobulbaceae bacterium]|jgi:RimJ/RimL family protein N-acetyltransferase|nr:GNAT family N-acetyltransferase [Desulfobulbaceae bacterium]
MNETITLRPATMRDADMLLDWRNDPETRKASYNTSEVTKNDHIAWLTKTLDNSNRRLFVAEEDGAPIGTVRADLSEGVWELSWTMAPYARGRGVAKRMVALLVQQITEPIRAEVKAGNVASARIAEHAGMKFNQKIEGVLHYSRDALNEQEA